jgi:hypothetical protein
MTCDRLAVKISRLKVPARISRRGVQVSRIDFIERYPECTVDLADMID